MSAPKTYTPTSPIPSPADEFPATWEGGHALVIEFGDEELHGRCQCGEQLGTRRPDEGLDGFGDPWAGHVVTLGN
jgi:hypothetical protein